MKQRKWKTEIEFEFRRNMNANSIQFVLIPTIGYSTERCRIDIKHTFIFVWLFFACSIELYKE
jgi:hypothetical protein